MGEIDLDNLTSKGLIDHAVIFDEFKKYLMLVLGYEEFEADFVIASDFENPYNTQFLTQDHEGIFAVDGKSVRLDFAVPISVPLAFSTWQICHHSSSMCLSILIRSPTSVSEHIARLAKCT